MVATVSPAADSYEETLSTLRYADRYRRPSPLLGTEDPSTLRYMGLSPILGTRDPLHP